MDKFKLAYSTFKIRIEKEYQQVSSDLISISSSNYLTDNTDYIDINLDFLQDKKIKLDTYKNYINYQAKLIYLYYFFKNGFNSRLNDRIKLENFSFILDFNKRLLMNKKYQILKSVHLTSLNEFYILKKDYIDHDLITKQYYPLNDIQFPLYCYETNSIFLIPFYNGLVLFNIKTDFFKQNSKLKSVMIKNI